MPVTRWWKLQPKFRTEEEMIRIRENLSNIDEWRVKDGGIKNTERRIGELKNQNPD
jgi:hypothetical protein